MKDFAFRAALMGLVNSTIWSDMTDNAVEQLLKYLDVIVAVPDNKFKLFVKQLKDIENNYTLEIKEILLEKNLSNKEKLELLKIKIK